MRTLFTALFILLTCIAASAQTSQPHMIVYLKDGSNVKGTVTVNDAEGTVMVVDKDKESHYYQKSMVAKIEEQSQRYSSSDLKAHGYTCDIELGGSDILAKDGGNSLPSFSFNIINSYLFSPYISLGLGIGTELGAPSEAYNSEMLSIYVDGRFYFTKSNIAPYADLAFGYNGLFMKYQYVNNYNPYGGGYTYTYGNDGDHGFMFNPSFGVRAAAGHKVSLHAGIGYQVHYLHSNGFFYQLSKDQTFKTDANGFYLLNALTIKAGFEF